MNKKKAIILMLFIFVALLFWWIQTFTFWASKFFTQCITILEKLAKQPQQMTLSKLLMTCFWIVFITFMSCLIAKKIALRSRTSHQTKNPLSETK